MDIGIEQVLAWSGTENHLEDYEIIADWFYKETGSLRPGKDCRVESLELRQEKWKLWSSIAIRRVAVWLLKQNDECLKLQKQNQILRGALKKTKGWSECYCLSDEEASVPGGMTCPTCIAQEALEKVKSLEEGEK